MRAVAFDSFGDPAEVLHLADRPVPAPGPGEIRVKLILSPIHNHDVATIRGAYGHKPTLPAMGGTEALGVVDAHGEGVRSPAIGQRVTMAGVANAWADYFVAPAARAVPLPDSISDEIGCQLSAMPLSALMALDDMRAQPGEWIVQNAATGAVGKTLAMIAEARGVRVINVVRRDAGVAELAALGISDAFSTADPDWRTQVREKVGDGRVVAALYSVGGEESGQLLSLLSEGGMLLTFGAMANKPMVLNPGDLIFKQATVKGFWAAKRGGDRAAVARMIGELIGLAASGVLRLPVEKAFGLDEARAAALASAEPGRSGKIAFKG
jgi:NADPH2:quinone reductase